jgi:signal transduction histidine kinase
VLPELAKALEVTSAVLAPLTISGKVIGGLTVFRNGKAFSDFELRTLNLYAQSVSAAYENRLTLSSLEQRVVERTNELAETNAELESFARTVSHDLRAPLRAMEGFAAALAEDYGHQVDEEGREFIQHIIDSAKRLDCMVADLLAYSRLGRTELRVSSVALNDIVNEAMNRLSAEITSHSAVITVEENMPTIVAHKSTLVQVITNLLSNALKFVPKNTRPEVRIWATTSTGEMVRLTVQDNGIGVEPAYQKRIFQVFERLHGIESYPGTGIGLAIVARACERLGGSCGMDSTPGQGSQFWIEFPKGTVGK